MKILFLSDIHGIYDNLEYIDSVIERENIDKLVVLGDLYYCGFGYNDTYKINSSLVNDFLTKYKDILICMRGNCDSDVDIKVSDFPICNNLSMIFVDGINIYITHGNEYNNKKNNKFNNNGVLVYGHEHVPYIDKIDNMVYICVGSISLPRNNSNASYMIYENRTFTINDIYGNTIDSVTL